MYVSRRGSTQADAKVSERVLSSEETGAQDGSEAVKARLDAELAEYRKEETLILGS